MGGSPWNNEECYYLVVSEELHFGTVSGMNQDRIH